MDIMHNAQKTCRNCPAASDVGSKFLCGDEPGCSVIECHRRPELGFFDPGGITFEKCSEWEPAPYGYMLKDMRVMILGIDGYLGWTLALWLGSLGFQVSGIDNYSRRDCVMERGAHTVVPIARMTERLRIAQEVLDIGINFRKMDVADRDSLRGFIKEVRPEAIVHYAEYPSAPYSMIDADHAIEVQRNNVLGTLGLLFAMRDVVPAASLIKLGTMGEYGTLLTGRPIFEGIFPAGATLSWKDREWAMEDEMTPRYPGSFYHVSKVQDTHNVIAACKWWGLRSYDIMQGVIYGVNTEQVAVDPRLRTRLDIDEWFGTVVNRYVAQAVIGIPLTVYGVGGQTRGFIALEDAMQCMTRLICSPPKQGQYEAINQMSGYYSVMQLAETVMRVGQKEFGLSVEIQRVENPRVEASQHPFEPIYERLPDEFGFRPQVSPEKEIYRMFELLTQPEIKSRIEQKKHLVLPRTWWSGAKRVVKTL